MGGTEVTGGRRIGRRRGWTAWGAAGLLALGACGGSGDGGSADEEENGFGPLAELMGWGPTEPAEDRRRQLEVEELTADCMSELGWEYQPVDWSAMSDMGSNEDNELMTSDPEAYGEKYGYGVMRNYELYEAAYLEDPEAAMEQETGGQEFVDPNQEFVESLSESEREQYYRDLYGDMTMATVEMGDETADTAPAMPSPEEMGCANRSSAEVYETQMDPDVQDRLNEYWESAQDDPRIDAANAEWAECMGDLIDGYTGYDGEPVDAADDMWSVFETKKYEAQGLEEMPFEDESELEGLSYSSAMMNEDGSGVAWVGEAEPIPAAEITAITTEEIDAWKQDRDCQDESDVREVQREMEQELVDQLLEEFPELASTGAENGN